MLTIKYSDEEYEWEYIESDEENNQNAKADENKATVSLPAKVHALSIIGILYLPVQITFLIISTFTGNSKG